MDFLPYAVLAAAVLATFCFELKVTIILMVFALTSAFAVGRMSAIGLASLFILILPYIWLRRFPILLLPAVGMTVAAYLHWLPGFFNLKVIDQLRLSPDSIPFTMYLNFDKAMAGLLLSAFFLRVSEKRGLRRADLLLVVNTLGTLVLVLLPISLALGYVKVDFKLPSETGLWALNNLLFVCMAEEALFRGAIQGSLTSKIGSRWAILVGALLFGAAHFKGGMAYVALASVAGLFYGYAYARSERLLAPMLVHFGLNLVHFLVFSYPALA